MSSNPERHAPHIISTEKLLTFKTRSREDLLQHIERLKQKLRECRDENRDLVNDYNGLRDEFNEAVDLYARAQGKIKELREKNRDLRDEVEDLEDEQKQQEAKAKEKTRTIRNMVKERNDLQERLGRKVHETDEAHVALKYEVKQSIAASTRLDKQLGDEAFRKALDQIYEKFRECFLVVRRRQEFGEIDMSSFPGDELIRSC